MKKLSKEQWIVVGLFAGFLIGSAFEHSIAGMGVGLVLGIILGRRSPHSQST